MENLAIKFDNVWEKYRIKFIRKGKIFWEEIWALENVNFEVEKGEVLGIIGENGAGKTTLLKLIAGMLTSDKGEIYVRGKVSTLMELGVGFNPEFTGRENIILNARMYGLDEEVLEQQMVEVIKFAGLGKFIDAPIKYYSQGMYMRLAFALAIYVEPDILLIDDILAVGDEEAQQKCIKKIFELKQAGETIVVVSHNMNTIGRLCDRVILLERGKIVQKGSPQKVVPRYQELVGDKKGIAILEKEKLRVVFNNGRIIISYDSATLTKGMGGYASFLVPSLNTWSSSFNLNWQIKNSLPDEIIVEGLHQDGVIAQTWIIQIQEDQLQWQVEIKDDTIRESHIDLLLIPDYSELAGLERDGEFGPFVHKSNWQQVGLDNYQDNIVGIRESLEKNNLPSLTLEIENKNGQLKLLNTGYNQEARVIQSYLMGRNRTSLKIKVFPNMGIFKEHIKQLKTEFFLRRKEEQARLRAKQQQEEARLRAKQQKEEARLRAKQKEKEARLRALRTISSDSLRLFADVEARCLRLYYKDKEITKSSGLHISFLFNKSWYDSFSCNWQVEKKKDTLILNFTWKQPQFSSIWKLILKDNYLLWQTNSKSPKPLELDKLKFGLLLIPEYKSFFAAYQQRDFPDEFTKWQDMTLEEPKAELFGLRKSNELPAITLENSENLLCIIQNSDSESSCRTLQLSLPKQTLKKRKHFSFSTKLSLLEDEVLIEDYIKEEKQKLQLRRKQEQARLRAKQQEEEASLRAKQQQEEASLRAKQQQEEARLRARQEKEQARLRALRTISSKDLRLFADVEARCLRLYYKDKEITKGNGLHTPFYASQRWFILNDAQWQIQKVSERKLVLTLNYQSLSLSQIWTLVCKDDNTLEISIEIEVNKPIFFTHQIVTLELQDKYKKWESPYEQGDLLVNQYIDNIGPVRLKDNRISKVVLAAEKEDDIPKLFFCISSHLDIHTLSIKRREADEKCLIVDSSLIIPKKERLVNPGRYTYFEGKVVLDKDIKLEKEFTLTEFIELKKGNLKFIFDRGRGRIFWRPKELTTGLGAYTSVRSSGIWYDSYQAIWQIIKKGNNKIIVSGDWPHIPISQTWQLELIEKNLIYWKVEMEIYEEVNLEIEQANIMLSSEYKNWIVPGFAQGDFLDEYAQDYDISPFRFWYGKTGKIATTAKTLPRIIFKSDMKSENLKAIVENTENLYNGRRLQYQKSNTDRISPKRYTYFEGVIRIEPKG